MAKVKKRKPLNITVKPSVKIKAAKRAKKEKTSLSQVVEKFLESSYQ